MRDRGGMVVAVLQRVAVGVSCNDDASDVQALNSVRYDSADVGVVRRDLAGQSLSVGDPWAEGEFETHFAMLR